MRRLLVELYIRLICLTKILKKMKNQELLSSISIVELEDRFETSVFALDARRCSGNEADVTVEVKAV